jgi:hypothetical protein
MKKAILILIYISGIYPSYKAGLELIIKVSHRPNENAEKIFCAIMSLISWINYACILIWNFVIQ